MNIPDDVVQSLAGTEYRLDGHITKEAILERFERAKKAGHQQVCQALAVALFRVDTSQHCGDEEQQLQRQ